MRNLENKIKTAATKILIETLTTIFKDMNKMALNIMIQEELEIRIGEDQLDVILNELR